MKKLFYVAAFALSVFSLPGCGDDEEKKEDDPQPQPATIEGTWATSTIESKAFYANGAQVGSTKVEKIPNHSLSFTSPSSYKEELKGSQPRTATGTYSVSNSTLNITVSNKIHVPSGAYHIDSLTDKRLVIHVNYPANGPALATEYTVRANR